MDVAARLSGFLEVCLEIVEDQLGVVEHGLVVGHVLGGRGRLLQPLLHLLGPAPEGVDDDAHLLCEDLLLLRAEDGGGLADHRPCRQRPCHKHRIVTEKSIHNL